MNFLLKCLVAYKLASLPSGTPPIHDFCGENLNQFFFHFPIFCLFKNGGLEPREGVIIECPLK